MATTVSDFIVRRLQEWGVRRIFGYPGDGISGMLGALGRLRDGQIELVQVRHQEMAALMACAHAKFTGQVGVCIATSGPGAIHFLNGLYDAKLDHQPVVAIVGQQARGSLGGEGQQDVDLVSLYKDVAQAYVQMMTLPAQARSLVDRAFRIALSERTVTCLILPKDVQEEPVRDLPLPEHGAPALGTGCSRPVIVPREDDLKAAAAVLNAGRKVAMLVGAGALGASAEVEETADLLGAPVAKALLGKATIPDEAPWCVGALGLLGTKPSWNMMADCDTLLMVGSGFPYPEFLPKGGQARGVQIDLAPRMLSLRYPMEVCLTGDAAETLRALRPHLACKEDRSWRERFEGEMRDWWQLLKAGAMTDARPVNPQRVFWDLSPRLPDGAIVTCDSGSVASWFARDVKLREGMMASLSGTLATMGSAVPYAIAAKMAHPDRAVVALVGDGAMQMSGNAELITVAKYWKRWSDPRLVVLVLNNRDLSQVTWEMRVMEGNPKLSPAQDLPDFPYAAYAESIGLRGFRAARPALVGEAWERAFAADRPAVLEVQTDPEVSPLPPHISFEQAQDFSRALLGHGPDAGARARRALGEPIGARDRG